MSATTHLTPNQLSTLLDLAGWVPAPWSPALDWAALAPHDPSRPHYRKLIDAGLIVVDDGTPRVNGFFDPALAVISQPDVQVSLAVPDAPAFHLCRGANLLVGCFEFVDGAIAISYPVLEDELLPLLGAVLGADDPGAGALGFRTRLAAFDMAILMLLAAGQDRSMAELAGALQAEQWATDPTTVSSGVDRLESAGLVSRSGDQARIAPTLAGLVGPGLTYAMAVRRIERLDQADDTRYVHVYRNGSRLLACRPHPTGGDQLDLDCWETSLSELAGLVAVMTMSDDQLSAIDHSRAVSA